MSEIPEGKACWEALTGNRFRHEPSTTLRITQLANDLLDSSCMCSRNFHSCFFFFSSAGVWGRDRMSPERRDPKILEFHFPTIEKKKKGYLLY